MFSRSHAALVTGFVVLVGVAPSGCGDDGGFDFEGEPGTLVSASFPGWVPHVAAGVEVDDHTLIVDTGAPVTILDRDGFAAVEVLAQDGKHALDLSSFGLLFPGYPVVSYNLFGGAPGTVPDGLLGGDLVRHFALRLDYQGSRAALFDVEPPGGDTLVVGAGDALVFEVLGGGPSLIPGECPPDPYCGVIDLPATRIVLPARFEGGESQWVVIDTGASAIATSESFVASLPGNGSPRPRLDGVTISTANGLATAALSRVARLELGAGTPARIGAQPTVTVDDVPMLVLPNDALLQSISDEVGHPVVALVGGTFLREFQTTIDYPRDRLVLERYRARSHIPTDEYVGVGFTLVSGAGGVWQVGDVYTGTDAQVDGLAHGQVVEQLAGQSITGLPRASVEALLDGFAIGQDVPVGILEGTAVVTFQIAVEDLLPSYPAAP